MSPESVTALLAALGDTPNAVAEALRAGGFRGTPRTSRTCPIARYLQFHGVPDVAMTGTVEWSSGQIRPARQFVRLPDACMWFVTAFDAGKHPDLVEPR